MKSLNRSYTWKFVHDAICLALVITVSAIIHGAKATLAISPGVQHPIVVLDSVEQSISANLGDITQKLPSNIFPAPPIAQRLSGLLLFDQEGGIADVAVDIDEPDDIDPGGHSDLSPHSLPTDLFFVYTLSKVEPEQQTSILKRLEALKRSPLYGRYKVLPRAERVKAGALGIEIQIYMGMNNIKASDLPGLTPEPCFRARYTRELSLEGGTFDNKMVYSNKNGKYRFPKSWSDTLAKQALQRIWVECAVKVDSNGIPVDAPLRHMRPIALQTMSGLYLISQSVDGVNVKHGYFVQFNTAAFRITGDSKKVSPSSIKTLMDSYAKNLKRSFEEGILLASEDTTSPAPPGEYHFRRDFKPSKVLKGFHGPFNELSYYNVRWWRVGDDGQELYTLAPAHKGGYGAIGSSIVIQVSHSLTISAGLSNEYSEPTSDQVAKYHAAISEVMLTAIQDTAAQFRGVSKDGVYEIDGSNLDQSQRKGK